jgi:hypothetical protein
VRFGADDDSKPPLTKKKPKDIKPKPQEDDAKFDEEQSRRIQEQERLKREKLVQEAMKREQLEAKIQQQQKKPSIVNLIQWGMWADGMRYTGPNGQQLTDYRTFRDPSNID